MDFEMKTTAVIILSLITLWYMGFITMLYIFTTKYYAQTGTNRIKKNERLAIFLFWWLMLMVEIASYFYARKQRKKDKQNEG